MQFVLAGSRNIGGLRVFAFEGIETDRTRTMFFVRADLALSQSFGIRVQELPLLCLRLLETHTFRENEHVLTYGKGEMRLHKDIRASELTALKRKRPPRRPAANGNQNQAGSAHAAGPLDMVREPVPGIESEPLAVTTL